MPRTDDPLQSQMFNSEYIEHLREEIEDRDEIIAKLEAQLEEDADQTATLRGELGV